MSKKVKTPWPTKAVMHQIYDMHLWGGTEFDFYSGFGSHNINIVKPYLEAVTDFLKSFPEPLTVCDLGCGDFNIGKHLVQHTKNYIAVDIVETLIERNKKLYQENNLEFHCLDITKDELPPGDCVILRQVLQHLSNEEITDVIKNLKTYKYIILTEHIPSRDFIPNKDIISGQGIRIKKNSGVNLLEVPFNLKIMLQKQLTEFILKNGRARIVTIMFQQF